MSTASHPFIAALSALDEWPDECIPGPNKPHRTGYVHVKVNGRTQPAHVLALERFSGPRPGSMEAAHSCGNRSCVNPRHLRWDTPKGNAADRTLHGTQVRGSAVNTSKLTAADVREIRALARGGLPYPDIAARYGVTGSNVGQIVRRRIWAWLT